MRVISKNILLLVVVLLLGTNIATIATYLAHKSSDAREGKRKTEIPDTQMGRFFADTLNLDGIQQDQFREFRRKYNRSANKKLSEMSIIRNEMARTLNSTKPDKANFYHLANELGEKHREIKELTFDYYLEMQSVLNEEQQEIMVGIFQAMLTETGDAKTPVHGGQGRQGQGRGRGQGWRYNQDTISE